MRDMDQWALSPSIGRNALLLGAVAWVTAGVVVALAVGRDLAEQAERPALATPTVSQPVIQSALQPTATPSMALPSPQTRSVTLTSTATLLLVLPSDTPDPARSPTSQPLASPTQPVLPTSVVYVIVTNTPSEGNAASTSVPIAACTPPAGWVAYQVEDGDTLFGFQLGSNNAVDVAKLMQANCLTSKLISIGQVLYLPPGAAELAPKVDDSAVTNGGNDGNGGNAASVAIPGGPSRAARCPCQLSVRAGWRLEQIAAAVDKAPVGFSGADFLAVTGAGAPISGEFGFLASRPAGKSLEGFMFPGTYTVQNETSAQGFRDMLLSAFGSNVGGDMQAAFNARGLSVWEAVNYASIVQRESGDAETQKIIASIFFNRRDRGMVIGSYTAVQYAWGGPGNWWPRLTRDLLDRDTPYAITKRKGLPPTPISNPGLSALLAVAYPAQTDYLYMNTKCGGGGNFYARTYEEFVQGLKCNQ